jgi:poly(3-hydroxybutyrate) depolymerase
MKPELKTYDEIGRSLYVVYPDGDRLSCYENTLITLLRENDSEEDISALLANADFRKLANRQRFVLLFPNPVNGRWNWDLDEAQRDDLAELTKMVSLFTDQPDMNDRGIYHNMHNARYFMGVGSGASMLHTLAACNPVNVAGIFTIGGKMSERAKAASVNAAVSAILWDAETPAIEFFKTLNQVDCYCDGCYYNSVNDAQIVYVAAGKKAMLEPDSIRYGWEKLFSQVCRPNSCEYGDMGPRTVRDETKFIVHENDPQLGDNDGIGHTWFETIPENIKAHPEKKVPLMVFNHGGADTPGNICNTIKMHEVAEKNGFILVYPWATSRWGWNQDMARNQYDDVAYLNALISYMKKTYAIDETRVYIGGFSNGSAMAQVFAMTNPEIIAGVCADNTRWCQDRNTLPFAIAGMKKLDTDYRMPVWYTYGTRDVEYPAVRGSGQQVQYDFWKAYNNITCKPTPYIDQPESCGVGVRGDGIEEYFPNPRYPLRKYTTHRFFSNDPTPLNLYNYSLADGKGHDCNPEEAWLGWNYIKQFRRMPDGSLVVSGKEQPLDQEKYHI